MRPGASGFETTNLAGFGESGTVSLLQGHSVNSRRVNRRHRSLSSISCPFTYDNSGPALEGRCLVPENSLLPASLSCRFGSLDPAQEEIGRKGNVGLDFIGSDFAFDTEKHLFVRIA